MNTLIAVMLTLLSLVQMAWAQIGYNANTNSLLCSKPGGHYCVHGSLQGPTMISCVSTTTAEIRSCNIELAHILPPGYKDFAICYETAPILGDALCAFNGTGYPRSGKPISIPETAICNAFPAGSPVEDPGSNDNGKGDVNDSDTGEEESTKPSHPMHYDHNPDADADAVLASRQHSKPSEPEPEKATTPSTTRPDNEKGTIQPLPTSLPLPGPVTPTDSVIVIAPSTLTTKPGPATSQPGCADELRTRDPNSTLPVYITECGGSMTLMPTPTPTFRRPRLADKCAWTPTPLYRTGAGVVRSSSSTVSPSESVSVSESIPAVTTSAAQGSGAKGDRVGFVVFLGWLVGWGVVFGWD
ncbi:hypothetical protein P170DRAFT_469273 [Aspergillus steynii IBT 23096]|uniref:Uncharacterized protein n=1 Tax=Aspergillus steynii IBT 23096 TaxID=1392250 RepID=A0A2I2GLN3_9EURO|nr:uncharacterized protein P170DRAFT_469273 [Aspergillus steynii IBT 23096]PLB53788.1 hypothetical protein P170DRAFT_469273 [Aspergillus steynii IBT 23096]